MSYDVFVSYSHNDKPTVDTIVQYLESNGLRAWYAPRDITPGREWAENIVEAISESKAFVLIFTDNSNASLQVRREVDNAINTGIPVLPFKLTESMPSGGMEYYLSTLHWLDAVNVTLENAMSALTKEVKAVISGKGELTSNIPKKDKPSTAVKSTAGKIIKILLSAAFLATSVFFGNAYFKSPGFHNDNQLALLYITLACFVPGVLLILSLLNKLMKRWKLFILLPIEILLFIGMLFGINNLEKSRPEFYLSDVTEEQIANITNFGIAASCPNGYVYYLDKQNDVIGIYRATVNDFKLSANAKLIKSGLFEYINISDDGEYIYCRDSAAKPKNLCKIDTNSSLASVLMVTEIERCYCLGEWILYGNYANSDVRSVMVNGAYEYTQIESNAYRICLYDNAIYYQDDYNSLYCMTGKNEKLVSNMIGAYYVIQDGYVYYSDSGNENEGIYRFPVNDMTQNEKLSDYTATQMLVYNGKLYYINKDEFNSIYALDLLSKEQSMIRKGNYSIINIIEDCLYLCTASQTFERVIIE